MTFLSKLNAADTPRWHEAMNGPFKDEWWKACEIELETLKKLEVWDVVDREDWMNVIPGIWAFRIKRNPENIIKKFKARFCARGDKQTEGK